MKKLQIIFLFLFILFLVPSVSAMENIQPWKDVNWFSVKIKWDNYQLQYNGKVVVSRKGTMKNWKKYSNKESPWFEWNTIQCGKDDYYTLEDATGSIQNRSQILKKKDQQKCLNWLMSRIYSVSKNSGRYYIIGVGIQYRDWSSWSFYETYVFDTKTRKLLQLKKFSEYSEAPSVTILEWISGIYIVAWNVTIVDKELSRIITDVDVFFSSIHTCSNTSENSQTKKICVDFQNDVWKDDIGWLWIDSIELLSQKRIKLHILLRASERKLEKIISL